MLRELTHDAAFFHISLCRLRERKTKMETETDLLTTGEFAVAMRTTRKNVRAWVARGIIRRNEYVRPNRRILIRREALYRLATPEQTKETPPTPPRPRMSAKARIACDLMNLKKTLAEYDSKKRKKHGRL